MPVAHYDEDYDRIAAIAGRETLWVAPRGMLRVAERKLEEAIACALHGPPFKALLAFSGTISDGGMEYTEAGMSGFPETQTAGSSPRRTLTLTLATMGRRGVLIAALLLGIAGCDMQSASVQPWPIDPDVEIRPDAMTLQPHESTPGAVVAITFPKGWDRGILYAIDEADGDGWQRRYMLISDANGATPRWFSVSDDSIAVEAIGITGTGPDRVLIPEPLALGDYRICTANAVENVCAAIEVVG